MLTILIIFVSENHQVDRSMLDPAMTYLEPTSVTAFCINATVNVNDRRDDVGRIFDMVQFSENRWCAGSRMYYRRFRSFSAEYMRAAATAAPMPAKERITIVTPVE